MISSNEFNAIANLDLDPIKVKLMHKESGEGWSQEKVNTVELEYRRFLYLMKMFPNEETAPQVDVDTFWHYHILDTMKYATDCQQAFGYFLHHYPYIGLRGEDDVAVQQQAGKRMQELYEATFGAQTAGEQAWCGSAVQAAAWCGVAKPAAEATAWCGSAVQATAWCGSAKPAAEATAWCGSAKPAAQATAWCGSAKPAAQATAWCGVAKPAAKATAWCGAAKPAAEATAWCGVASKKTANDKTLVALAA